MKLKKYNIILLASAFTLLACDDYLSQVPDNRANPQSPEAVQELLVSAYPETSYTFVELMSDNVGDVGKWTMDYDGAQEEAYYWKDVSGDNVDTPDGFWDASYAAIAAANHALSIIEEAENPADYDAQKAEALLSRAYNHFMLASIFAKPYDPKTAKTDLGVPYVTTPENVPLRDYYRETLDKTYELIEKDLLEGIKLANDNIYNNSTAGELAYKYHFTKSAAYAFAARFYQYRGLFNNPENSLNEYGKNDWERVIFYANKVLYAEPAAQLRDWNGTYSSMSYSELEIAYSKAEQTPNIMLISQITLWGRYAMYRYKMTPSFVANVIQGLQPCPMGSSNSLSFPIFGQNILNHIPKFKEHFKYASINATTGWPYVMFTAFTMDELLLNRAEAYIMTEDYTSALKDLNSYYSKRVDNYSSRTNTVTDATIAKYKARSIVDPCYTLNDKQALYLSALADIRQLEFLEEGLRWFDVRRFNIEVTHMSYDEKIKDVLKKGDPRRIVQIPSQARSLGLTPNPR